nr:hypothetical protein [Tanacetum cinerariifolium]
KSNDESKKQTIGSKRKGREYKVDDDDETKKMKTKSKISDENNKNSKIRTRTTPTTLFNAMAILNGDIKKCLHEMGFGSMIGMGIHELLGKLGFYVIDNLDTETNVLSLTDNSILVTLQSVHDILGIPIEDFNKKDLVRNDENDDTTATTKDKNDLLHSDSKMKSDSLASDDDNQKSDDDDGKQDVVMNEIDEQNKEDVCKEAGSIRENKCVEIRLTFKRRAWRNKSVMDNENKDADVVELSSSIKRCGHRMKHSYHLDVKDTGNQTVKHNDANKDIRNTDLAFDDIRDEQTNDDYELSNNADGKSEKEDEEFDVLAITICNVCHHVPLRVLMPNENLNDFLEIINIKDSESEKEEFDFGGDTGNEEKYDPKKADDYKGEFYKSPYELKPIEPKIRVSASEKLVADTLFAMMYKPRIGKMMTKRRGNIALKLDFWKDDDKTARKYCFKTGFLQANFLDKNVDANMKVKNFEKKLKQSVNNDTTYTTLMKLQQIQFVFFPI